MNDMNNYYSQLEIHNEKCGSNGTEVNFFAWVGETWRNPNVTTAKSSRKQISAG